MDTSDPGSTAAAFTRVTESLATYGRALTDPASGVQAPRLHAALRRDATCTRLRR